MKPTSEEFMNTAHAICDSIPFGPQGIEAKAVISDWLERMVATSQQLNWLKIKAITSFEKWPGCPAIRDLFVHHFPPADGIECEAIPSPEENEMRYLMKVGEDNTVNLLQWNQAPQITGQVEPEPPPIPKAPSIPRLGKPDYLKRSEEIHRPLAELDAEVANLPPMRPPRSPEQKAAMIAELEKQLGMKPAVEVKT